MEDAATRTRTPPPARARPGGLLLLENDVSIPADVFDLASFRRWARSDDFPERGRIDFVAGRVEVDMSPEDIGTHNNPKTAITAALFAEVTVRDLGQLWSDRVRLSNDAAGLSVEPDALLCLWGTLESGQASLVPKATGEEGRYVEVEGRADLVVEIVSDSSEIKDTERLRRLYHAASVPEYWIVDARSDDLRFTVLRRAGPGYRTVRPDATGFARSVVLDRAIRLVRAPARMKLFNYRLEIRPSGVRAQKRKRSKRRGRRS